MMKFFYRESVASTPSSEFSVPRDEAGEVTIINESLKRKEAYESKQVLTELANRDSGERVIYYGRYVYRVRKVGQIFIFDALVEPGLCFNTSADEKGIEDWCYRFLPVITELLDSLDREAY